MGGMTTQDGDTSTRGKQTNPSELSGIDVFIDITSLLM